MDDYRGAAALRAALRRFLRRSEEIARRNGLTPQQYLLLLMIKGAADGSERSTVSDLVEQLQLRQSTVTELVQRAEEAGLLERTPSSTDARVVHLTLTERGDDLMTAAFRELGEERRRLAHLVADLDVSR